ncbi:hypothetical protein O181_009115 [Austropuccinia psidii MF-1]|uniref:Integrase catalytic domain-containing protein n=1 Tax=Austropuccinia psidii MF-1 TaxID=1389203 RepID=A0A9Q3BQP0_9BASI|nr:hypothetical protein [Austropuccinia psidii MF-1]
MPPRRTTDDLGIGQPEHVSDDLPYLLNAISSLTDKVNELQLDLENQKQINNKFNLTPANPHTLNHVQRRFVTTIKFVYKINQIAINNFLAPLADKDGSSVLLVILKTIDDLTKSLLSKTHSSPASLFSALKLRFDCSSRLDKLDNVRHLLASFKFTNLRNTTKWLNLHQEIFAKLLKWEVSLNEVYELLVQADLPLPDLVNHNVFEVLMHQWLNTQEATSGVTFPIAIVDHNASISAVTYTPPIRDYQQPVSSHNPFFQAPQPAGGRPSNQHILNHVIRRAANFRGRGQSKSLIDCCAFSKSVKQRYTPATNLKISETLDLLVSDVIGPFDKDLEGNWFILTLWDHTSTYTFTAALKSRAEVPEKILFWIKFLFDLLHKYQGRFCSDNASEYSGKPLRKLCAFGIKWIPTKPYHPDQNGEAERANRTIGDMARTMLHSIISVWCKSYCPHSTGEAQKLDVRATGCIILTYPNSGKGWTFLHVPSHRIFTSTSAVIPDYQHLPIATNTKKGDVAFILNHLQLGEVATDSNHQEKDASIDALCLVTDLDTPRTEVGSISTLEDFR